MASIAANGITIEYEQRGSGPPLLLIMGLGGQLTDWPDGFLDLLAEHFTVIRFDNRDGGLSTEFDWVPPTRGRQFLDMAMRRKPDAGYLMADMANDAAGLLDALQIDAAHVVGMSMGGMIAQQLTIDHPSRVLSLTSIMSNTGDGKGGVAPKLMMKLARRPEADRAGAVQDSVELFGMIAGPAFDPDEHRRRGEVSVARSFRPQGTARQLAAIAASPDRTAGLGRVTVPTLVIHGLVDPLVQPSGGVATAQAVPGARLLAFPDMGHDLPVARWTEMVEAIVRNCHAAARVTAGTP